MRPCAHPRFTGLDVECGAPRSKLFKECFFGLTFDRRRCAIDISVSWRKPDSDLRRLNSFVLREKVSKSHGFGDCVICVLILVDRLDTITKSRKRLVNGLVC